MNFHEKLNQVTRTKEETYDKEHKRDFKESYDLTKYFIDEIKEDLVEEAKEGMYKELENGKKFIEIVYKDGMIEEVLGLGVSKSSEVSENGRYVKNFIDCYIDSQGSYDGFMKRMREFAKEDGVSFVWYVLIDITNFMNLILWKE